MSFKFVEVQRMIKTGFAPGLKFIAKIFRIGSIKPDVVVERLSKHSQLSKACVIGVLAALEELVIEAAQDGEALKLPYLGMFIPSIEATAQDELKDVDVSSIKRYSMRFYPSVALSLAIKNTGAEKVNLSIAGLQIPEGEALTEDAYQRLQKEQLRSGGILQELEATNVKMEELEEPENQKTPRKGK